VPDLAQPQSEQPMVASWVRMSVQKITGWDGRTVEVCRSRGSGVCYLVDWENNLLPLADGLAWPASLRRQVRAYVARRSWFAAADGDVLAAKLGRISKFQSVNAEDPVTWSWFGTLALTEPQTRRHALRWLYDTLSLDLEASSDVRIDQWPRVVHPNAPASPNGPEIDARIDDAGGALIYVEAKWDAGLGTGKGADEGIRDDQIVLRRASFRADPALADDGRLFVVLGVSNETLDLTVYDEPSTGSERPVQISWISWDDLAGCDVHPLATDFRRYIAWKRSFATDPA
jgi:hypothetical protein